MVEHYPKDYDTAEMSTGFPKVNCDSPSAINSEIRHATVLRQVSVTGTRAFVATLRGESSLNSVLLKLNRSPSTEETFNRIRLRDYELESPTA